MTQATTHSSTRDDIVPKLYDLFRRRGFEGVALSDISDATGLGRSSLYHHFPGGKDEMATAVADFAYGWVERNLCLPLRADGDLQAKISDMLDTASDMYEGGGAPCLVASMMISPTENLELSGTLKKIIQSWISALRDALSANGLVRSEAERRAAAAVITIEGALIVSRACGDRTIFSTAIAQAGQDLLAPS